MTESAATDLRKMASEIAPSTTGLPIADQWSGLRPATFDGMPVIGRFGEIDGLFVATAHYRNGILLAPLTAKLAVESLVDGNVSHYLAPFGPDRFRLRGIGTGN